MTLPRKSSFLCDKNRLFTAKRIAALRYFHEQTERKTDSDFADTFEIHYG